MHLSVKGKQLDVGDALRTHVKDTLNAVVGKYFTRSIDANVVISREAHLFTADISVHVGRGIVLQSRSEATEPYPAFDAAAEKLAKRLRRHKRRLRDHHRAEGEEAPAPLPARQYVLDALSDDHGPDDHDGDHNEDHNGAEAPHAAPAAANGGHQPVIVAEMQTAIETLSVGEAVMRMDLADLPALMFRSRAHGGLNMVYRRADGHVGWVDPTGHEGAASAAGAVQDRA